MCLCVCISVVNKFCALKLGQRASSDGGGERDELVYTGGMLLDFEIWHLYVRSNSSYFCSRDDYENICVCVCV